MSTHRIPLDDLERGVPFADRHIGPRERELETMLAAIGAGSLDELAAAAVPDAIRDGSDDDRRPGLHAPARRHRDRGAGRAARPRRAQHGDRPDDRAGLLRHRHPAGHPAQRAGEPRLVHGVHAVPAGDQPGAAGGVADVPDHRRRPHRPARRRRVDAGRGHRRRRGDDAPAPRRAVVVEPVRGRRRHPPADDRGAAHARRAARDRPGGRPARRGAARRRPVRAAAELPGASGRGARPGAADHRRPTSGARSSPSPRTCWGSPC